MHLKTVFERLKTENSSKSRPHQTRQNQASLDVTARLPNASQRQRSGWKALASSRRRRTHQNQRVPTVFTCAVG